MKKLPIILNVVLLVAVIILYVLHFNGKNSSVNKKTDNKALTNFEAPASGSIVFINIDSVFSKYDMYKDVSVDLQEKANTSEANLQTRTRAFEKKYKDFMYKAERQLETRAVLEQMQANLGKEQQELMTLQNQLQYKLAEEQQVAQRKVLNSVMEYLKKAESEQPYQFVLGNSFGGNILYANENLDISNSVVAGLNEAYNKSKEESEE